MSNSISSLLQKPAVFVRDGHDLARLRIKIRGPLGVGQLHRHDDVLEGNLGWHVRRSVPCGAFATRAVASKLISAATRYGFHTARSHDHG